METEYIKIKCPHCGAILQIKLKPGIEARSIKCPVCKEMTKFTDYKRPNQAARQPVSDDDTNFIDENVTTYNGNTPVHEPPKLIVGELLDQIGQKKYALKMGLNLIGRKAKSSSADVQIETEDLKMSRAHSVIEVSKLKNGEIIHYFSNAKNKNDTYINALLVENGDRIVLRGDELIKMADTVLKFVVRSADDTII